MDARLAEFGALLEDYDARACLVAVESISYDGDIVLVVDSDDLDPALPRPLRLRCTRVRRWWAVGGTVGRLLVSADHPVLRLFDGPTADLFFFGAPADPEVLAYRLLRCLDERSDGHLTATECFNGGTGVADLLSRGRGLLATGPAALLRELDDLLTEHDVAGSLLEVRSRRGSGDGLKVLDLGCALVVAENVVAENVIAETDHDSSACHTGRA